MIHVLIVEDDPMVCQVNSMYLNEIEGFQLAGTASSVTEAKKLIEKMDIHLLLLDIYMPGGEDGLTLLSYIRKKQLDLDVIIISAASDTNRIHRAIQNGAADYIIKPFQFDRFRNAMVSYRERKSLVSNQTVLSQKEVDKLFLDNRAAGEAAVLPKGLTQNTLEQILLIISRSEADGFSTEEIAEAAGISRISVRKYLSFLEKIDVVTSYISYGHIGRPLTRFCFVEENRLNAEPYLNQKGNQSID